LKEIKYIAVEGVIGVGKTALAKLLADKLTSKLILEEFETNPFLEKFYSNKDKFAFQTQMFFLINRYKQQEEILQGDLFNEFLVADYIFAKDKLFAKINLHHDELKLYESIFPTLEQNLQKPDLVIYLHSSVDRLMYNIKRRKRSFERNISRNYIESLNEIYNNYFFRYNTTPLLIVNTTEIDFVNNQADFDQLFNHIFREDRGFVEYFNPKTLG